jgi:hypothetical protein
LLCGNLNRHIEWKIEGRVLAYPQLLCK